MSKLADLHIHTHYSDSTSSPQEVVAQARGCGLECIAITDHDTVAGIRPTMEAAQEYGIEVIPGIELSTECHGKEVHILGYCFDYQDARLMEQLEKMQDFRQQRMARMIAKLKALGVDNIEQQEVQALAKSKSVGRPHLAQVLVNKGWVADIREAFSRYLDNDAPAYVSKFQQTPAEAIALIHSLGGVAVLAHPMLSHVDAFIPRFVDQGLDGLEVCYPCTPDTVKDFYEDMARKHHLLVTGGSDAHGTAKKHTRIGKIKIYYPLVEALKERARCQKNSCAMP